MIKKNFFINSSFILLIFLLDRISKIYVINLDKKFLGSEIFSSKFLNINLIWNEGIAFGLLSFNDKIIYNLLTFIIFIIILIIFFMVLKSYGLKKYSCPRTSIAFLSDLAFSAAVTNGIIDSHFQTKNLSFHFAFFKGCKSS